MRLALALAVTLVAAPAHATLIEVDVFRPGDARATLDDSTGLLWLDPVATEMQSWVEVVGGPLYAAGWRHATEAEFAPLMALVWTIEQSGRMQQIFDRGYVSGAPDSYLTAFGGPLVLNSGLPGFWAKSFARSYSRPGYPVTSGEQKIEISTTVKWYTGHLLVRPIPEPGTASLACLGLAGLAVMGRRARA